ncbi:MAG: hypothetical protein OXC26_15315 [Albidovulum sp.]|nr:hypothetical protein [Albidovulum sp.]
MAEMGPATFLAIGAALFALFAPASQASPLPNHAIGIWSLGACGEDAPAVLVNSHAAIMIENHGGKSAVAVGEAEFVGDSIVLTLNGEKEEVILPPLEALRSCRDMPGEFPLLFAEAVSVFGRLDELEAACSRERGSTARCVAMAFDTVDITGDGKFSRAEISRVVRAAGFFIGQSMVADGRQSAFVPLEELVLVHVAALAIGPLVAANLINSFDFDGDGFVSLAELMQDRVPEEGLEGMIASAVSGMPPEVLSKFLKSATGIFDELR